MRNCVDESCVFVSILRQVLFRSVDVQWAAEIRHVQEKNRSIDEIPVDMDTSRLRANKSLTSSARVRFKEANTNCLRLVFYSVISFNISSVNKGFPSNPRGI